MRDGRWYAGGALAAVIAQLAVPTGLPRNLAHFAVHASALVVFAGIARHRPSPAQPWYLLGAALALNAVARFIRLLELVRDPASEVSPAVLALDVGACATGMAAALWFVRLRRPSKGPGALIDGAMVVLTVLLLTFAGAITGHLPIDQLAALAIATTMAAALIMGARLVIGSSPPLSLLALLLGAALLLLATLFQLENGWEPPALPRWVDVPLLLSSVLFGWSALHPSMARLTRPEHLPEPRVRPGKLIMIGWSLMVGPVLVLLGPPAGDARRLLALGTGLLTVLVLARIGVIMMQREEAQSALARSERRYRSLMQHAFDAVAIIDGQGDVTYASPALGRIIGNPDESFVGTDILRLVHPDDATELRGCITSARFCPDDVLRAEIRLGRSADSYRWADVFLVNRLQDPSIHGIVLNLRDVTDRKRNELELSRLALHDSLTGLPNRHALLRELEDALRYQVRRVDGLAVLFTDLDDFKSVNDRHGHAVGDQLLVKVARRLHGALRPGDVLARFGGDEFVILATGVDNEAQAISIAQRLRQSLSAPFSADGDRFSLDITVGIALTHRRETPAQDLLDAADLAMYRAKREGAHIACHRGIAAGQPGRDLTPIPR